MPITYIFSFILLLTLTLANVNGFVLGRVLGFVGVPTGYRNLIIFALLLPAVGVILLKRRQPVLKSFWGTFKLWVPWIAYLGISGSFSPEGTWKFEMYIARVVLPCMILVCIALSNPEVFEKYFFQTLLGLNLFLIVLLWSDAFHLRSDNFGFEGIERLIWLSRGLGINIVYVIALSVWKRRPFFWIPMLVFMFIVMVYIGSRGPVISTICVLLFVFVARYRRNIVGSVLGSIVVIVILLLFSNVGQLSKFAATFSTHGGEVKAEHFWDDRVSVYLPSLIIIKEHPVFGVGLGKWWSVFRPRFMDPLSNIHLDSAIKKARGEIDYNYPHNIVFEILTELGLVGFALFCLLFLPFRRFVDPSNEYNLLLLLCFLFALSSSDLAVNSGPMIFGVLGYLRWRRALLSQITLGRESGSAGTYRPGFKC